MKRSVWTPAFAVICGFCALIAARHPARAQSASPGEMRLGAPSEADGVATLDELVDTALRQNPSISGARQAVEAKRAKVSPAETLPEPTLSFQSMGDFIPPSIQKGDPSSGRFYGVEQEIPYPGKLGLKGKIATAEAEAEDWNAEATRRQVVSDVKVAYYDLYLMYKSIDVVEKDRGLLLDFAKIAESKYRVGMGSQQDVLKAQVEVSKTLDRLTILEQRKAVSEAKMNSLLYRQSSQPLGRPADFQKAPLRYSLEQLEQLARDGSPKLKTQEKEIDRSQYAVELAKKEYYPDFALGFTYVERDPMKEMYGLMFKAKVPLYFWRNQREELRGSRLTLSSAQKMRDNVITTLSYEVKNEYIIASTSQRLVDLYGTTLLPQARLSVDSALASYQVGSIDFLSLLDSVVTLLDYEIKYYEALTDFQKALARLEPTVGVELTK